MKKHFLSSVWARLYTALLILSISFIVYSCHKEAKLTAQEINEAKAAQNFPIKDASAWFGANKTTLTTKIKINSDASFLNKIADFTPVWDSARTAVDTNYYVVEAPAKYAQRLGFSTDSIASNINGSTRLLILKSKKFGTLSAALMQIRANTNIGSSNVHYMAVPTSFSGNIFYTSLQGAFICGYIYSAGKIIKSSKGGSSVTAPGGPRILQAYNPGEGNNCETITTNWYSQTCYWNADDSFDHCSAWQYMYTTVDTYCDDNNNSGGGGAVPAPPDCPEGTHPAGNDDGGNDGGGGNNGGLNVESINGKLVVHFAYGSSSNCVPDVGKPVNNVKDSCLHSMVDTALSKDIPGSIAADVKSVYNIDTRTALSIEDLTTLDNSRAGQTNVTFFANGTSKAVISLNKNTLSSSSSEYVYATILHELGHSVVDLLHDASSDADAENDLAIALVDAMALDIHRAFPNLTENQYKALAWGGLEDTNAYNKKVGWGSNVDTLYTNINTNFSSSGSSGTRPACSIHH